jgi:hypothetical protein
MSIFTQSKVTIMSNNTINSISEFLLHAGTQYQVFDLGRETKQIDAQLFLDMENGAVPCQRPRQGKAWFALCFSQLENKVKNKLEQAYLWFIALPIDENSKIIAATRNHFLQVIVDALQNNPVLNDSLPDNPYLFAPTETQRGQLSALILSINPHQIEQRSKPVIAYLNAPGAVDWRKLVTQDIYCSANIINNEATLTELVINRWSLYEEKVKSTLLKALSNVTLSSSLQSFFISELKNTTDNAQSELFLLALSGTKPSIEIQSLLAERLLAFDHLNVDTLSIIAGRFYWHMSPGLVRLFFNACLEIDTKLEKEGTLFAEFYKDLVAVPHLRNEVIKTLNELRNA